MTAPNRRLAGKVAFVLGGGASGPARSGEDVLMGNGRAISLRLATEGARVGVADISLDAAQGTVGLIEQAGGEAAAFETDASDPEACRAAVLATGERFGQIDIVVCNVGIHGNLRLRQQTVDDWDRSMAVNARAHWVTAQAALEFMLRDGGGAFIFVGSLAGELSSGTSIAYEASKAAQLAIMRHIAVRYGDRGVRSNALVLGVIDTGMVRQLFGSTEEVESRREAMAPMRRQGRPDEVAAAAAFLASDDASYLNGAALAVDGGLSAQSPTYRPSARAGELVASPAVRRETP